MPHITKTHLLKYIEINSDIFLISAQNIHCGYLLDPPRKGGSNEHPQSMFLSRNEKYNVYTCKLTTALLESAEGGE